MNVIYREVLSLGALGYSYPILQTNSEMIEHWMNFNVVACGMTHLQILQNNMVNGACNRLQPAIWLWQIWVEQWVSCANMAHMDVLDSDR